MTEEIINRLKNDFKKGSRKPGAAIDLSQVSLEGQNLDSLDFSGLNLQGVNFSGASLQNSNFGMCNLKDANFYKARLNSVEFFKADLQNAVFNESDCTHAGFGHADLTHASFLNANLNKASFTSATLNYVDFRTANLENASLREAVLTNATLTRASLKNADLKNSDVEGADFHMADLSYARVMGVKNFKKAAWVGADIFNIDLRGAYMIRRYIMDENYLYEFKTRSSLNKFLYLLWWLSSDCGRSLTRWALLMFLVILIFAMMFHFSGVDYGAYKTPYSDIYYSIVTFTGLGYGDVMPASLQSQVLASIEAIAGYVGLGGFLSILSNKLARRAE
ncbi:MAG: pentapeptide repeat-containing protein [Deltaproteobacteria bacterium]|nr:pentapeptide repeat-containing protein [Deltaproteobacteria bacterium]